jgi:hypothetical protein
MFLHVPSHSGSHFWIKLSGELLDRIQSTAL